MPRSMWSGSLSFGLVNVPVVMVTAVRDLDLHFRQLHESDGAPIEVQRWCSKEDVEVPFDEIEHSFEFDDGSQVIITDEELEAVEPKKTRTIDIEQFVDLADVDPIYFDHPYFLLPASEDDEPESSDDLMAALEASLGGGGKSNGRNGSGGKSGGNGGGGKSGGGKSGGGKKGKS